MFRVIRGVVLAAAFLGVCAYHPQWAIAQVSPTNTASITGSVLTSSGAPVAGAKVSISGLKNATTQTDAHGLFVFIGLPFGTYQISATAAGLGTASEQVVVQDDINVAIQFSGLKAIAHVSTTAQFNVTSASITHVDPLADALNGQTDWRHILEEIPGVSITAANDEYIGGHVPGNPLLNLQISIDGALPYETAELFDDMPLIGNSVTTAPGTGTNLGVYPLSGFGAADVVRGPGANAPSIVDSIGGSFVLHPPGLVTKDHEAFSFTRDPYGGIDFTGVAAEHFGKLSVTGTYGFENSLGPSGSPTLNQDWPPYLVDGRSFEAPALGFNYPPGYQPYGLEGYTSYLLTCCYSQDYGWSQHSGSLALSYAITRRVTVAAYYSGQSEGIPNYQAIYATDFIPPAGYTGSVPAGEMNLSPGNYGYESGNSSNGFYQSAALFEEKVTAQIGNGVLRVAFLQNTTTNGNEDPGNPGPAVGQLYGGGLICSNTSPSCSTGTYSPVVFNGGTYNLVSSSVACTYAEVTKNHDLLLSYTTSPSNNTQAGISFVQSSYDQPFAYNLNYIYNSAITFGGPGVGNVNDTQETKEMRIFFGAEPTSKTTVNLSWYFVGADYHLPSLTNAGLYTDSTFAYSAPRLGFVWQPSAKLAVRAAIGGGFAEAPLGDLIGGPTTPYCFGATCTLSVANLNLQPEKSFAFDLGTDVRLNDDTIASFDLYQANLFGQVNSFTSLDGTYTGLPLYVSTYGNLAHSRYEGVLLDLRNTVSHGLTWSFAAGLTRGYLVSVPAGFYSGTDCPPPTYVPTPCTNCSNEGILTNINFDAAFSGVVPYAQGHATIGYQWKPSEFVTLMGTYYGNNNSYLRPAFAEWDADASYPVTKYGSLLLTFTNVTGIYDQAVGIIDPASISIVPAIPGVEPYAYNNGVYGPRAVTLTLQLHNVGAR